MNETDVEYIKKEANRCLETCKYIDLLINNYSLNNEQWVLNYKDYLNSLSITP